MPPDVMDTLRPRCPTVTAERPALVEPKVSSIGTHGLLLEAPGAFEVSSAEAVIKAL